MEKTMFKLHAVYRANRPGFDDYDAYSKLYDSHI